MRSPSTSGGASGRATDPAPNPARLGPDHDLATLLESSRELLMVLGTEGVIRWLSPTAARWLGPAAVGRSLSELAHRSDAAPIGSALAALAAGTATSGQTSELTCRLRTAQGGWLPMELTVTDRTDHPTISGLVCVARESVGPTGVTARLIHQASHDTLTALPNHSLLMERLSVSGIHGGDRPCAVLYLDLDGFKAVNDALGHAAGDGVLVAVANRLRRAVRPGDTVARLHGDEFVAVAAGVSDGAVALEIAGRIVESIRRPIAIDGRLVEVSVSVGVALGSGTRAVSLLEEADRAMFEAKEQGRNRCSLFSTAMRHVDEQRRSDEQLVRGAIDDGDLRLLYQPIVELCSGRVAGVEAWLRVRRPDGTLVTPVESAGIAGETGLASTVGSGLLELACTQAALWRRDGGGGAPAFVALPVSRPQLADPGAAERIAAALEGHALEASTLCLDLPAGSLAEADPALTRTVELLTRLGVRLAIDGFGGGNANLSELSRFGIDLLRMDRSLMPGLGAHDGSTEVVKAVIGLGDALGMTAVAIGVETALQDRVLTDLGCRLAQGSYFGLPTPAEESPTPRRYAGPSPVRAGIRSPAT